MNWYSSHSCAVYYIYLIRQFKRNPCAVRRAIVLCLQHCSGFVDTLVGVSRIIDPADISGRDRFAVVIGIPTFFFVTVLVSVCSFAVAADTDLIAVDRIIQIRRFQISHRAHT